MLDEVSAEHKFEPPHFTLPFVAISSESLSIPADMRELLKNRGQTTSGDAH